MMLHRRCCYYKVAAGGSWGDLVSTTCLLNCAEEVGPAAATVVRERMLRDGSLAKHVPTHFVCTEGLLLFEESLAHAKSVLLMSEGTLSAEQKRFVESVGLVAQCAGGRWTWLGEAGGAGRLPHTTLCRMLNVAEVHTPGENEALWHYDLSDDDASCLHVILFMGGRERENDVMEKPPRGGSGGGGGGININSRVWLESLRMDLQLAGGVPTEKDSDSLSSLWLSRLFRGSVHACAEVPYIAKEEHGDGDGGKKGRLVRVHKSLLPPLQEQEQGEGKGEGGRDSAVTAAVAAADRSLAAIKKTRGPAPRQAVYFWIREPRCWAVLVPAEFRAAGTVEIQTDDLDKGGGLDSYKALRVFLNGLVASLSAAVRSSLSVALAAAAADPMIRTKLLLSGGEEDKQQQQVSCMTLVWKWRIGGEGEGEELPAGLAAFLREQALRHALSKEGDDDAGTGGRHSYNRLKVEFRSVREIRCAKVVDMYLHTLCI